MCPGRMCNDYTLLRVVHSGLPPSGGNEGCGRDALLAIGEALDLPALADAVLDNEGDAVFLVNGGDGELIRYDIGSGRTSRIGRRGSGPGEFGRPVSLEPHGRDSLLAYDVSLGRFSVFSRSGEFGRIFTLPGDGGRGRQVVATTRMGARIWAAVSLGSPPGLMGLATPPGTKARDTVAVLEVTTAGRVSKTVARVPHRLWERGPDTGSFELIRDQHAAWATIAGGGGRLFVATFGGDSLEVSAYRAGDGAGELARYPVELAGLPRRGLRGMLASREGSLWIVEEADESTVLHVFGESGGGWVREGRLGFGGTARILDVSGDRAVFLHFDELDPETVVVGRAGGDWVVAVVRFGGVWRAKMPPAVALLQHVSARCVMITHYHSAGQMADTWPTADGASSHECRSRPHGGAVPLNR